MKHFCTLLCCVFLICSITGCRKIQAAEPTQPQEATIAEETICRAVPETIPTEAPTEPSAEPPTEATMPAPPDSDHAFVRILDYIPSAHQELRYGTEDNFTGTQIYSFCEGYLRWGTVKKLMQVSEVLAEQGLYLKIWDGFRPVSAQYKLWEVCPDPTYVANPETGYSAHSRGNTIDLTLVDENGQELEMPTGFDDFSVKANRDYSDCSEIQAANAKLLEQTMERFGFRGYFGEWWHFSDTQSYPVETEFEPNAG